jgi:hypothetical protein
MVLQALFMGFRSFFLNPMNPMNPMNPIGFLKIENENENGFSFAAVKITERGGIHGIQEDILLIRVSRE